MRKRLEIAELALSVRASNVLQNLGVHYLDELVRLPPSLLMRGQNCGKKTVKEIKDVLAERGFVLREEEEKRNRSNEERYWEAGYRAGLGHALREIRRLDKHRIPRAPKLDLLVMESDPVVLAIKEFLDKRSAIMSTGINKEKTS